MTIEFYGLPGSGKTTIANRLSSLLNEDDIPSMVMDPEMVLRGKKGIAKTIYLSRQLYSLMSLLPVLPLKSIIKNNELHDMKMLITSTAYTKSYYSYQSSDIDVKIIDEGFLQRVFSLYAYQRIDNVELISRYMDLVPKSDICIYLKVDPETAMYRMKRRGSFPQRMKKMSSSEIISILTQAENIYNDLRIENSIIIDAIKYDIDAIILQVYKEIRSMHAGLFNVGNKASVL